jgi:hypothetical protein
MLYHQSNFLIFPKKKSIFVSKLVVIQINIRTLCPKNILSYESLDDVSYIPGHMLIFGHHVRINTDKESELQKLIFFCNSGRICEW